MPGPQLLSLQNQKPHGKNKIPRGKSKNLTAKTKYLAAKAKTSRQNQRPHRKTKYFTAKTKYLTAKANTSRQKQIPTAKPNPNGKAKNLTAKTKLSHGKTKNLTAKPKTSRRNQVSQQKPNTSRQKQILHGKSYNLGQNKMERQTPILPNQGWSRAKGKNAPFSHPWFGREGGSWVSIYFVQDCSLPADVLWGLFVTHSFLPDGRRPWGRYECVTNKPHRTSALWGG